jgi:hypothetical protein
LWRHYFNNTQGLILIVDLNDISWSWWLLKHFEIALFWSTRTNKISQMRWSHVNFANTSNLTRTRVIVCSPEMGDAGDGWYQSLDWFRREINKCFWFLNLDWICFFIHMAFDHLQASNQLQRIPTK